MESFIDEHRGKYGVEPICRQLPIAPSTYYEQKARQADPSRVPPRHKRDRFLCGEILRVWHENFQVYGARKVWHQLNREGIRVARCTVERLMKKLELKGVVGGRRCRTTVRDFRRGCPADLVNRHFKATRPNQLWVADITFVSTWSGFAYTAFVVDAFARRIVGWRVMRSLRTEWVLDALEQALWSRGKTEGLIHHSDRSSQYLSIRYSERLREAEIESSVGSVGDSYDNALAETITGLYKAELIHRKGPWRTIDEVEYATLEWVDWFNHRRLMSSLGHIPPAEFEERFCNKTKEPVKVT